MIPILPSLLIIYYTGKNFTVFYLSLNLFLTLFVYFKASKYYFPHMKNIEEQYFHENYKSLEREELFMISLFKIYHGFLNYFWLKTFFSLICFFLVWFGLKIIFLGKKDDYIFTKEDRRKVVLWNSYILKFFYNSCGVIIHEKDLTKDLKILEIFRKYLGPNYEPIQIYSTVMANHISWADILYLEKKFSPSFISKDSVKSLPFVGYMAWAQKSAFIARKEKDAIQKTKDFINMKQKDVFEGKDFFPLGIYPEGTTSNGKCIPSFKHGAFYNLYPAKCVLYSIKAYKSSFPVCAAAMDILLHITLSYTFLYTEMDAIELPVFAPNDFLYENYSYLGKDKSTIYAEAMRRVWSEILESPINDGTLDTKLEYKSKIKGKKVKDT